MSDTRLFRKVNDDERCDNYNDVDTFREALPWDEERVTYISLRWDVTRNAARTLILKEVGKSTKDIARLLYVTQSTVQGYVDELCDKIHVNVVMEISYKRWKGCKYDVWGRGEPDEVRYSPDYVDVSPKRDKRDLPVNKGCDLEDIPTDLITIRT